MCRIAFIGPPGSGKSTVSRLLHESLDLPIISPGNVLRNPEKYPWIDEIIRNYDVHSGHLLSDVKLCLIIKRLLADAPDGWIMDGMPRQVGQYETMMAEFPPTHFVIFEDPGLLITTARIAKRADGRLDDTGEVARIRRETYESKTVPVINRIHADTLPDTKVIDIRVRDDNPPERVRDLILNCL